MIYFEYQTSGKLYRRIYMDNFSEKCNYIEMVKEQLAQYFNTNVNEIHQLLKDELATSFLLIWPIFEQTYFDNFCKKDDIEEFSEKYGETFCYDEMFQHFYSRYQNNDCYRNLVHQQNFPKFKEILNKSPNDITNNEKLLFITFVVYRYRNNIFHGNKGIKSWSKFKQQITYCIEFMTSMIDKRPNK